ncbi:IS5/IS1182 family transposase, partial [Parabacteroides distasonis]
MSTNLHTKSYNNNRLFLTIDPNEEISQNDPVRVVDSIVENLDLKDFRKLYKEKGRCPYHPKMM